jgi:DNA gyrase subunit A
VPEKVIDREAAEVAEENMVGYALSVNCGRAFPDYRDGLKPVHRRILWAMYKGGYGPDKPHKKSAKIVGEVMGR